MNVIGVMKVPPNIIPKELILDNYVALLKYNPILRWAGNSVFIASSSVSLSIFITAMAAYGFSFYEFKWKKTIYWLFVVSMMLPGYALIIPRFVLMKNLGILNTWLALILPSGFGAVGIFLFKNSADTLPRSFVDSARVDGAKELRIVFQIIMPLCKPIVIVLCILGFIGKLQSYLWPMLVINDLNRRPLTVGIVWAITNSQGYFDGVNNMIGVGLAGGVILFMPLFLIFLIFQRHFKGNVIQGGIK